MCIDERHALFSDFDCEIGGTTANLVKPSIGHGRLSYQVLNIAYSDSKIWYDNTVISSPPVQSVSNVKKIAKRHIVSPDNESVQNSKETLIYLSSI